MNESDCGRVFALLSEYLDQGLAPDTCEELEHHLSGCPTCMEFVQGLKRSMHLCRQYGDHHPVPPARPEFMADLRRAYEKMLARRRGARTGCD